MGSLRETYNDRKILGAIEQKHSFSFNEPVLPCTLLKVEYKNKIGIHNLGITHINTDSLSTTRAGLLNGRP